MKKSIFVNAAIIALAMLASCQKEQLTENVTPVTGVTEFTATIEQPTKTVISDEGKVTWVAGDTITVTDAASASAVYVAGSDGARTTFTLREGETAVGTGPYTATYGDIDNQEYDAAGANCPLTAAQTSTTNFKFSSPYAVVKITAKSDGGEVIDSVGVSYGEKTYTLDCGEGVALTSEGIDFFVSVEPATDVALSATFHTDDKTATKTRTEVVTLVAKDLLPVTLTFAEDDWESSEEDTPGALKGVFTVSDNGTTDDPSDDIKVHFSKGNLWYGKVGGAAEATFQFEGKQYEFHGYDSANNTWGLFGWVGASSTTFTSSPAIYGVSTSTTISDYGNVSDEALKSDWGKAIGDGNTWRTLSMDEWGYLFGMEFEDEYYVPKAGHPRADKLGLATVNNVTGLVLLPDSWNLPSGCEFTPTALDGDNKVTDEKNFSLNIYTVEQWSRMESAGAVFLPVAGGRTGSDIGSADRGYYWSSSVNNDSNAYNVSFYSEGVLPDDDDSRHLGLCVRLVTDVSAAPTPTEPDYVEITAKYDGEDNPARTLKWATKNLGADNETDYGKYYAWGDTEGQAAATSGTGAFATAFNWANCPFNNGSSDYDETYFNTDKQNEVCTDGVLKLDYDIANKVLGGTWRMPTKAEFEALRNLTEEWKANYNNSGVDGYLFTDKNNHSIFLPAAGCGNGTVLTNAGGFGYYWSSSLDTDHPYGAYCLCFNVDNANTDNGIRYYGQSVRALSE